MLDNIVSGLIAGGIGAFCVLPIDITKTRVQSSTLAKPNPLEIISTIYKTNGIRGFYAGGIAQILFVGPEKAVKFTVNDLVLTCTDNKIFSGMCAGLSQVIITNPMEILKIQSQTNTNTSKPFTISNAYTQIGGFKGLYKGVGICASRDIPFSGIYFPLYGYIKELAGSSYLASLVSGSTAAFLCTPMDIIKTRVQYKLNMSWHIVLKELVVKEGYCALFKGGIWRALKSGPQFMITQSVYNLLQK